MNDYDLEGYDSTHQEYRESMNSTKFSSRDNLTSYIANNIDTGCITHLTVDVNDNTEDSWQSFYDDTYRRFYYVNTATGVSQWEDPRASTDSAVAAAATSARSPTKRTPELRRSGSFRTIDSNGSNSGRSRTNSKIRSGVLSERSTAASRRAMQFEEATAALNSSRLSASAHATGDDSEHGTATSAATITSSSKGGGSDKLVDDADYEAYEAMTLRNYRSQRQKVRQRARVAPGRRHSEAVAATSSTAAESFDSGEPLHRVEYPMARRSQIVSVDSTSDVTIAAATAEEECDPARAIGLEIRHAKQPRRRSSSSSHKQQPLGGTNYDYLGMAVQYRVTRKYLDPSAQLTCLLCRKKPAVDVFFPCGHRCVCRSCIATEGICSESRLLSGAAPDGYCNCSLCAGIIKLILPAEGGAEVEKYWRWVYEEPVLLPPNFLRNFRHSAAVIRSVYINPAAASTITTATSSSAGERRTVTEDSQSLDAASKRCHIS